jgi:hypothetical protein
MNKKISLTIVMAFALLATISVSSTGIKQASAAFTHSWGYSASHGPGSSPNNKECGLWDDARGCNYKKCALLWICCNGPWRIYMIFQSLIEKLSPSLIMIITSLYLSTCDVSL